MTEPVDLPPLWTGPDYSGCLWPVDPTCNWVQWNNLSDEDQQRGLAYATSTLVRLTGGRVTNCPVTIRPCSQGSCVPPAGVFWPYGTSFVPGITSSGAWINNAGCACPSSCDHNVCQIALPRPVGRVDEVKVDGAVIDPEDYRVDDAYLLVWKGAGDCPWPSSQDLSLPDTEVGTMSVTMINGYAPDRMAAQAVAVLAYEFALACKAKPGGTCRLPASVRSVVRQGLTYDIQPGLFPDGFTGIREVDAYISQWNPGALRQDAAVWAPGGDAPRHPTIGSW